MTAVEIKHEAKRQEWQERIKECRSSGAPVQQWCAERKISTSAYYQWEREIYGQQERKGRGKRSQAAAAPEFVAAPMISQGETNGGVIMTLRRGTVEVDIYAGTGEREIEAVCRVLKLC